MCTQPQRAENTPRGGASWTTRYVGGEIDALRSEFSATVGYPITEAVRVQAEYDLAWKPPVFTRSETMTFGLGFRP